MLSAALRATHRPTHRRAASANEALVRVRGGFYPDVVRVRAHEPICIRFLREETATCSERVVFPSFGKSAMLPHGHLVAVDLPAATPGVHEFTCALNVLRGVLVVE